MPTTRAPRRRRALVAFPVALGLASLLVSALPAATGAAIHPDQAIRRTRQVVVDPSTEPRVGVTCPSRMRVVSGGAAFVGPGMSSGLYPHIHVSTPTLDGRGWLAAGVAFQSGVAFPSGPAPADLDLSLQVTILCRPMAAVGPYTVVVRDARPDGRGLVTASAECGRGKRVVTGGAAWRVDDDPRSGMGWSSLLASTPRQSARGWRASGYTFGGAADRLRVVLLCRPAQAMRGLTVRSRDIAPGTIQRTGRVSCPTGAHAITGGLEWLLDGKPDIRGFLDSSRVTADGKGWHVAATAAAPELTARLRVLCLPR